MKPIVYDLFCGLGGWSEAFIAEGYECTGFDVEAHDYGTGGYPGKLILRDVRSIHGSQLKDAAVICASPPCQEFSYMAMPWKRAKQIAQALSGECAFPPKYDGSRTVMQLTTLFNECFRIQREASEAAGRYIPLVVENVRGAQKWVGCARWHYGSFYLWGDVPALMPMTLCPPKIENVNNLPRVEGQISPQWRAEATRHIVEGTKADGSGWTEKGSLASHNRLVSNQAGRKVPGIKLSEVGFNVAAAQRYREGLKLKDQDGYERDHPQAFGWKAPRMSSRSNPRKAASAMIAKIPFALAQHIARVYKPKAKVVEIA